MGDEDKDKRAFDMGRTVALVVGLGMLAGAGAVLVMGGGPVIATIMTLIGASALSGWVRTGRKK